MPLFYLFLLAKLTFCHDKKPSVPASTFFQRGTLERNPYTRIGAITVPAGFTRVAGGSRSYAAWLRGLPLKKDKTVYLYKGFKKNNQAVQFAVLDISVGRKDLQQCADAVMRLRAEYLYAQQRFGEIDFTDNNRTHYRLAAHAGRKAFDQYLEKNFSYCGTASLSNQLLAVTDFRQVAAGDVLVKGGSPGHSVQVMDVAVNKEGKKIYLLAQDICRRRISMWC
ncbi:MAG: DUF4846 domain-containing protein [Bacteroidota bacterium]